MQENKTGAIICRKPISGTEQMEYEALLYIEEIPNEVTDTELSGLLRDRIQAVDTGNCKDILIRADINATANEIWEQYTGLKNDSNKSERISYKALL